MYNIYLHICFNLHRFRHQFLEMETRSKLQNVPNEITAERNLTPMYTLFIFFYSLSFAQVESAQVICPVQTANAKAVALL